MDKSDGYLLFEYTFHYMFIYPSDDWGTTMALIPFFITEEDIQQGVVEWLVHLQPLPIEEEADTIEMWTKHSQD